MKGTLHLLPTQLGNAPWPMVLPAGTREIVADLRHFIVENAKTTRAALKWLDHPITLRELQIEQIPPSPGPADIERLLAPLCVGNDVGLMSEAGCPGVADPGATIVREAHRQGITVRPHVGPSALLLALMASGLDGQRFAFHGYLPPREPDRSRRIAELERESHQKRQTQLFIETPYRNAGMLESLLAHCQTRTLLCLATDLTLETESVTTHPISHWRAQPRPDLERRPTVFLLLSGY